MLSIYKAMHYNRSNRNYKQVGIFSSRQKAMKAATEYLNKRIGQHPQIRPYHTVIIEQWELVNGQYVQTHDWTVE